MLVEILNGIGGCLIYIEKDQYAPGEYLTKKILDNPHRIYDESGYVIIRTQNIFSTPEIEPLEIRINSDFEEKMQSALRAIVCLCGCTKNEPKSMLRLPSDGWEELVDMWSCHDREFAHLTEQKMTPRKEGVLYSTLYLITESEKAPECFISKNPKKEITETTCKIFYNEISHAIPDEYFLFHYLYDIFQTKQEIKIRATEEYTIRLIDTEYTYRGEITYNPPVVLSLKIAYTKSTVPEEDIIENQPNTKINGYFTKSLIDIIEKNKINIQINSRQVSFIRKYE